MTDWVASRHFVPWRFDLWRFPGTRAVAVVALLYLYIPIVALIVLSFSAGDSSLARWSGFSLHWYADVLGNDDMLRAIRNSLVVAGFATVAGSSIATMAALATAGPRFRFQSGVEALIGLPLFVAELVVVAKRCHDVGLPGLFVVLLFVPLLGLGWLLLLAGMPGSPGLNAYGAPPGLDPD